MLPKISINLVYFLFTVIILSDSRIYIEAMGFPEIKGESLFNKEIICYDSSAK